MKNDPKKGVLLVNLGSPNSPEVKDVRKYLAEFLMDKRVIDVPYLLRSLIVKGFILPTRPRHSAKAYKKVWTKQGSPLIVLSEKFSKKVADKVSIPLTLAMRYGSPSIKEGLAELYNLGLRDILVVPLYPQYAMSTTETVIIKAEEVADKYFNDITLSFQPAFYYKEAYIDALSAGINDTLSQQPFDHLLFSYHGLPERHIIKTDITRSHCQMNENCCKTASPAHSFCYRHQCLETTEQVAKKLKLPKGSYSVSFQSRLGKNEWLKPYTADRIKELATAGTENLVVATPAFVADCLETLEEIAIEGKQSFIEAGGKQFSVSPCLNDDDKWVDAMSKWIDEWVEN